MTCIVGIEHRNGVVLAADALGSNGWWGEVYERKKIVTNGPLLVAGTGSYRDIDVMEHVLDVPKHHDPDVSDMQWVVRDLVKAIGETLEQCRAIRTKEGVAEMESRLLIAYRGTLYPMWEQFAVTRPKVHEAGGFGIRFAAFGSGGEHAWSYIKTQLDSIGVGGTPEEPDWSVVAMAAVHHAETRVLSVGGEVQVETQEVPQS